jgi:hypothetical protein
MGFAHRFRLWRPGGDLVTPYALATIDAVVRDLKALAARSRRYSVSFLVPMRQEMAYRYQEGVIYDDADGAARFQAARRASVTAQSLGANHTSRGFKVQSARRSSKGDDRIANCAPLVHTLAE